jgi:hypothetical protein
MRGEQNLLLTENADQKRTSRKFFNTLRSPPSWLVYGFVAFLMAYIVLRGIVAAALKPFFFDEIITYAVASQPSVSNIWKALTQAIDSHPPLFYLIERVALTICQNQQIALRLPSILALPWTLFFVFIYLKRRYRVHIAFLCSLLILITCLFNSYAINARAYSMQVACIACALVCYQRISSLFWAAMLSISLALAESFHYYAIFAMLPLVIAESFYFLTRRIFRWQVWLALGIGGLPLALCWHLLANFKTYYGAHIWVHNGLSYIPVIYGSFFLTGSAFGFAIVAMCVGGVIGARFLPVTGTTALETDNEGDMVEGVLLIAVMFIPFTTLAVTKAMHGILMDRYVLATILGVVLSMACVMSLARTKIVALFAVFIFSNIGVHEMSFWRSAHRAHLHDPAVSVESFVQKANESDLPVVISDGLLYLQLAHYASPEWKKRFVYLLDESKAVQYLDTDSIDKNLVVLRQYMPLETQELSQFTRAHREFLLYVEDPKEGFNWLPEYLLAANSSMTVLESEPSRKLYLVTMQ